jgi:cell division protein FtsB
LSQVANTFWDDRVERVGAAVRVSSGARQRVRVRRLVDSIIFTIVLAAAAICVSVYSRGRTELSSAHVKHEAAAEKLGDLTIKVQNLERDVKQLRTDSRVIELFARQKFGFVRAGDVVIKVSQDQADAATSGVSSRGSDSKPGGSNSKPGGSDSKPGGSDSKPVRMANLTVRSSEVYTDASN